MQRSSSLSELAKLGFEELSLAIPRLEQLVNLIGDVAHVAFGYLSDSSSPDRALVGLLRLAAADKRALSKVLAKESAGRRLAKVLGASDALTDHLVRFPSELSRFHDTRDFSSKEQYLSYFETHFALASTPEDSMRVCYRNQLLDIAILDLDHQEAIESLQVVGAALSELADAVLEHSLNLAKAEMLLEARYPSDEIEASGLAIIAMGKCGAKELNYISDVDVIFAYSPSHDNSLEIATRFATRLMRLIDSGGLEPPIWQVDPNLRPEGKSGALVRSVDSHVAYYGRWAQNWEFQALLKARFAAGNQVVGQQYIDQVKPLIWTNVDRPSLVDSIRSMRSRVLQNIPVDERNRDIKLGRGGLRDVEFTAQLLQMVHGVNDPALRAPNTLAALASLAEAGFLGRTDADVFAHCYKVLKTIEHRVQLSQLRRTHLIPASETEGRRVARAISQTQQLSEIWEATRAKVSELHDVVFYRPLLNAMSTLATDEVRLSDEEVRLRLIALGFADPEGASRHIAALTAGVTRRSVIQRTLLPVLLRWLAEGVFPDRGLLAFRRLSEALGETPWFLRMLRDSSGAAESLMKLLASSEFITKLLEQIPESASWLDSDLDLIPQRREVLESEFDAIAARSETVEGTSEAFKFVRRREMLRIAMGAVLGKIDASELSLALTQTAEVYLWQMLRLAHLVHGSNLDDLELGIVAMGRFGGGELGFGSDLDVMFFRADSDSDETGMQSQRVISTLQELVKDSMLPFELDLDLRPEGKRGATVRTVSSYQSYYERWAEVWEFQALLRARVLVGLGGSGRAMTQVIDTFRYPQELSLRQELEIKRIKARVEAERLPQGADPGRHLKLGKGSISDVEWLIQLIQLKFASRFEALRTHSTTGALESAKGLNLLKADDCDTLEAAWSLASRIRSANVLANDRQSDMLPTDRRQLEGIARMLEYEPGSASVLEEEYLAATRRARAVYERVFLET